MTNKTSYDRAEVWELVLAAAIAVVLVAGFIGGLVSLATWEEGQEHKREIEKIELKHRLDRVKNCDK